MATLILEEKAHARFGASSAERWLNCSGSAALVEKAPSRPPGPYAAEGTEAHFVFESLMKSYIAGGKPYSLSRVLAEKHGEEMVRHALEAFKWVEARHAHHPGATVLSEVRVDLPVSHPDQFGTVDAAIVEVFGRLTVIDFKYGQGVVVDPEENEQLIYYALGLAHQFGFNFDSVELVVIQPRAETESGETVRTWVTDVETLEAWREKFEQGIKRALKPNAPLASGSWCRWCPASVICPKLSEESLAQAKVDFDPVEGTVAVPGGSVAPIQNLGAVLDAAERIEEWLARVREHALHVLESGGKVPGWKLVAKRSTRKWVEPEKVAKEARKFYGDGAFSEPELLSPAQFEKQLGTYTGTKDFVAARTSSISSGTTLVPESDSRPPVNPVENEFDRIELKGGEENGNQEKAGKAQGEGSREKAREDQTPREKTGGRGNERASRKPGVSHAAAVAPVKGNGKTTTKNKTTKR